MIEEITFFDGNLCSYQFMIDFFCVLSFCLGEMFIKRAQIRTG